MKTKAFIYIVLTGILWGMSGLFVHALTPFGFSSLQMTAMRGGIAAICFLFYALIHDRSIFKISISELILFALSGLGIFGTASCYFASMQASGVSTAVVLMYTAPIFVMAYSVAFLGEKLTPKKLIAVIFMLIGCVLVSGIIGGHNFNLWGILLGLMSGISYSAYNIFTKIQMRRGCRPLSATLYCFIFMGALAIAVSDPLQMVQFTMANPLKTIPLMLGLGIFTAVLPYLLYTLALRELPVGTASAMSIVEPMSACIFSITLLGEKLAFLPACGIILILCAVILLSKTSE
ncbi:MAG: DMT family transporter [Clostridia bacterium]|nr:DMT family transporter [Clostridia bacterium]